MKLSPFFQSHSMLTALTTKDRSTQTDLTLKDPLITRLYSVSVVVPVYKGAATLESLTREIQPLVQSTRWTTGDCFAITELILVWDGAIDESASVIKALAAKYPFIRPVWLSRHYGTHAATLAGISSCTGEWIITLEESGSCDPKDISGLLKTAVQGHHQLVYGSASPSHSSSNFRVIRGDIGRSLAAYCGNGVSLDAALKWVATEAVSKTVRFRTVKNYPFSTAPGKFSLAIKNFLSSSPEAPSRLLLSLGSITLLASLLSGSYTAFQFTFGNTQVQALTLLSILLSFFFGVVFLALGTLAEYLSKTLSLSMGKPLYVIQSDPPTSIKKV